MLAPPSVFEDVLAELMAIVGEPPIDVDADKDDWEENGGWPRELMWSLDLPGQTMLPKWHPHMVLCDPDIEKVVEMRYV